MQRSMAEPLCARMPTSSSSVVHSTLTSWTCPVVGTGPGHRAVPIDLLVQEQVLGFSPTFCFNRTSKPVGQPESTESIQPQTYHLMFLPCHWAFAT